MKLFKVLVGKIAMLAHRLFPTKDNLLGKKKKYRRESHIKHETVTHYSNILIS